MRIRQRKAFYQLMEIIRSIQKNPDDLEAVKNINIRILELVQYSEEAIARHKQARKELNIQLKTKRGDKKSSKAVRTKLKRVVSYIKAQRDQIYIWKCFGDTLVYIYLDSFAVKHAFFDTEEYNEKQDAGITLGKSGLYQEIGCLLSAIEHGVPAVLCDLTNILRYGDVCLLGDSDPYFIEVKNSPKLNQRGRRQQAKLNRLHDFMELDRSEDFRGQQGPTIRVSVEKEPTYHLAGLNECLTIAEKEGWAVREPEKGVTYIAISGDGDVIAALDSLDVTSPEIYHLNSYKNGHAWAPFSSFLLNIRNPEHALDFVEDRLYVIVVIEPQHICDLMQEDGWDIRYLPGELYPIQFLHRETAAFSAISYQVIARCAFEFMSLRAVKEIGKPNLKVLVNLASTSSASSNENLFRSRVIETFGSGDDWAKRILEANHIYDHDE